MAYILQSPVISTFVLWEIDATGETQVRFRQATVKETQERDKLVYGAQARTFSDNGLRVENAIPVSARGDRGPTHTGR